MYHGTFLIFAILSFQPALAFQIAPMGTKSEARHTNEPESAVAKAAGTLGILIKAPVHEEITQLGFGCPASRARLAADRLCGSANEPYANPFVIYGVRWNDVPPFKLEDGEGQCSLYGKRCKTSETIRLATQPVCWYCLFDNASKTVANKPIVGCGAARNQSRGNLMTRSHFGDLQFLHSMASTRGEPALKTQKQVVDWLEFAWKVGSREIKPNEKLRDITIAAIAERFSCSPWTVAEMYILGQMTSDHGLAPKINQIAFGSLLHTVQDSFAAGHTEREGKRPNEQCGETGFRMPPRIVEFHNYSAQDGTLHDHEDSRTAMVAGARDDWPLAVEATKNLASLFEDRADWEAVKSYIGCLIQLAPQTKPSSAGQRFARPSNARSK